MLSNNSLCYSSFYSQIPFAISLKAISLYGFTPFIAYASLKLSVRPKNHCFYSRYSLSYILRGYNLPHFLPCYCSVFFAGK